MPPFVGIKQFTTAYYELFVQLNQLAEPLPQALTEVHCISFDTEPVHLPVSGCHFQLCC